jgi:hypothetical protein
MTVVEIQNFLCYKQYHQISVTEPSGGPRPDDLSGDCYDVMRNGGPPRRTQIFEILSRVR